MRLGVVITAGGTGSRFSVDDNKLFIPLKGRPLLYYSCMAFSSLSESLDVVITYNPKDIEKMTALLLLFPKHFQPRLVEGGDTRKASVQKGVESLKDAETVMIHDGARPFISEALLHRLLEASKQHAAVIPGCMISETLKEVHNGQVVQTIPREHYRRIQTPQVFEVAMLKKAYQATFSQEMTDEAMLVEALGCPVHVVDGDPQNLKITTPFDYQIALSLSDVCKFGPAVVI